MDFKNLLALPNEVIDEVLGQWLSLQDLAYRLDSAVTNHNYREQYLAHLRNSHIVSNSTLVLQGDEDEGDDDGLDSDDALSEDGQVLDGLGEEEPEGEEDEEVVELDDVSDDEMEEDEEDGEKEHDGSAFRPTDALKWFQTRGIAIENIDIYGSLTQEELELTTARMVEHVQSIVFQADDLQELDLYSLSSCKNLKALTLATSDDVDVEVLGSLLQNFSKLESLTLDSLPVSLELLAKIKQTVGKTLELLLLTIEVDHEEQISLRDMLEGFPKLKCFNMIPAINFPALSLSTSTMQFPQLVTLEVSLHIAHAASFYCPNVENLLLAVNLGIDAISEDECQQINRDLAKNFQKLKYLQIANNVPFYDAKSFFNQGSFPSLLEVAIGGDYGVSNQAWSHLIDNCPNVEIFTLKREHHALYTYQHPGDEDFEMVISFYYGPHPSQIPTELEDDYLVDKLCSRWKKLQDLKLCGLVRISDKGFLSITKRSDTLISLHFTNPNLTLTSAAYQGLIACVHLKHLTLRKCGTLADEDVAQILQHDRCLEKLNVTHCPNLTSQVLTSFINIPNRIKEFNISYNKIVYDFEKLKVLITKVFRSVSDHVDIQHKHYLRHLSMLGCCRSETDEDALVQLMAELGQQTGASPSLLYVDMSVDDSNLLSSS